MTSDSEWQWIITERICCQSSFIFYVLAGKSHVHWISVYCQKPFNPRLHTNLWDLCTGSVNLNRHSCTSTKLQLDLVQLRRAPRFVLKVKDSVCLKPTPQQGVKNTAWPANRQVFWLMTAGWLRSGRFVSIRCWSLLNQTQNVADLWVSSCTSSRCFPWYRRFPQFKRKSSVSFDLKEMNTVRSDITNG